MDNHPRGTNPYRVTAAKRTSSSVAPFTFAFHSIAHEGHPERNEDTILVDRGRGLASVFDGVGGVSAGEIASQLAARVISQAWRHTLQQQQPQNSSDLLMLHDDLDIQVLVYQLLDCQHPGKKGYVMGYAHAGDSRIYLLRRDESLQRLTRDDGYFLLKIQDQTLSEDDAFRIDQATHIDQLSETERAIFEKRNGITQRLGHFTPKAPSLTIHTAQTVIAPGDRMLLCSDGIHDNLTDAEIETIVRRGAHTVVARHLVQRALDRSREECLRAKQDDMSAIVITCNY